MAFSLSAEAEAEHYRLESYALVESTNDLAAEFAKSGDKGRLWIVAEQQTGGRGRRGRFWHSPQGNLYATILMTEELTAEQTANLGFVAGAALCEALGAILPQRVLSLHGIKLKWPNDVLAGGAKLAGVLPEFLSFSPKAARFGARPQTDAGKLFKTASLVGFGVNIAAAPQTALSGATREAQAKAQENAGDGQAAQGSAGAEKAPPLNQGRSEQGAAPIQDAAPLYPIADLRSLGAQCSPQAVFAALSRCWAENYALWNNGQGMAALREKWLHYAAYRGEPISLMRNNQHLEGIFETIDAAGRLVLRGRGGERHYISAGDVYFGDAATVFCESRGRGI